MIDLREIEDTIEEIENNELTLRTCNDLANLYIIREHLLKSDLIPNSTVDDDVEDIQSLLVRYMMERDIITLNILLNTISKMISELYHTCDNDKERNEFAEFIQNLNSILTPTIL